MLTTSVVALSSRDDGEVIGLRPSSVHILLSAQAQIVRLVLDHFSESRSQTLFSSGDVMLMDGLSEFLSSCHVTTYDWYFLSALDRLGFYMNSDVGTPLMDVESSLTFLNDAMGKAMNVMCNPSYVDFYLHVTDPGVADVESAVERARFQSRHYRPTRSEPKRMWHKCIEQMWNCNVLGRPESYGAPMVRVTVNDRYDFQEWSTRQGYANNLPLGRIILIFRYDRLGIRAKAHVNLSYPMLVGERGQLFLRPAGREAHRDVVHLSSVDEDILCVALRDALFRSDEDGHAWEGNTYVRGDEALASVFNVARAFLPPGHHLFVGETEPGGYDIYREWLIPDVHFVAFSR